MTLYRARRDAGGTKAAAQTAHRLDHRSAQSLTFSLVVAERISPVGSFKARLLCLRSVSVMPRFLSR
jgi:hypothetical protein